MRLLLVVALLVSAPLIALAADPPGGPGWYQAIDGFNVSITGRGTLFIAPDTPGQLIGVTGDGMLTIRFERGIALWLGREIVNDALLTINVPPSSVRAFVKQPFSRLQDNPVANNGGAGPGVLGGFPGTTTGAGVGGRSAVGVERETTVVVDDTVKVVQRQTPPAAPIPDGRGGGSQILPPSGSVGGGGGGGATRVIAREDHEAWLLKVLRLWGEDGARCETKSYGPGWISICEPRAA
jgi:hypothetical protein